MRTLTALLVSLCLVSTASAQFTVIDDLESYTVGSSISGQGGWMVQRNSSAIGDTGYCLVMEESGDQFVRLMNRDLDGAIDTVYAALDLGVDLVGQDTLKVTFRAAGWNDTLMTTNALDAGWTDLDGDGNIDDGGQGCANYSSQAAMVALRADIFKARDGGGYAEQPAVVQSADTWYDLYMMIDSVNDTTMYAIVPAGDALTASALVLDPTGDLLWGHRNTTYDSVENLKFLCGGGAWPAPEGGWTEELPVDITAVSYMNGFAIPEPATMSLLALGGLAMIRRRRA